MEQTIFERIIQGEIPCTKVYEDDTCLVFLDIQPLNLGHTLVIPKVHSRNIFDTPDETVAHLFVIAKKVALALKEIVGAEGINIYMNNEAAAGQMVFHTHIHVIPRYSTDGYVLWHGNKIYSEEEKNTLAEKLIHKLQ